MLRLFFLFLVFGLFACSPAERPADSSVALEDSSASPEATPEPTGYTEYLWCSDGENYSQELADGRNSMWIEEVNALGMTNLGSAEIVPSGWSSENFDRIAILFWENKEARDAGWEIYLESGIEDKLNESYPGVQTCGGDDWVNVYPTNAYLVRAANLPNPFTVGYQFCSFNEGKGPDDVRDFLAGPWAEFLARYDSENPDSPYGLSINVPDFDDEAVEVHEGVPDTFDYVWVNLWGDEEEREKGWSAVEEYGQGMMEAGNAASTCSEEQVYAGRSVKIRS